jgi:hypothetical protein
MSKADGTFLYLATYPDEAAARADYTAVKQLHAAGIVGSYDAAVVTKDAAGKIHEDKDETATRHGAWWGIAAGAAVGVLFPPAVLGAAAAGGVIGGVSGHLAKGMSRSRVKELGDFIDPGRPGRGRGEQDRRGGREGGYQSREGDRGGTRSGRQGHRSRSGRGGIGPGVSGAQAQWRPQATTRVHATACGR